MLASVREYIPLRVGGFAGFEIDLVDRALTDDETGSWTGLPCLYEKLSVLPKRFERSVSFGLYWYFGTEPV